MPEMAYPKSQAKVRPFRIYHEQEGKTLRGRHYSYARNAHDQAAIFARWYLEIGDTVTVLNTNGIVLGQYTRKTHSVGYRGPMNLLEVEQQQKAR